MHKIDPILAGSLPDFRAIIAFRIHLVHGYSSIRHDEVWMIVQRDVPALLAVVTALLSK